LEESPEVANDGVVGDESALGEALPYRERWDLSAARRFFARSSVVTAVSRLNEQRDHDPCWQDVTFMVRGGVEGVATVMSPLMGEVVRGVVLAHGGSEDGRRFFVSEAADLACCGAAVILPAVRVRQDSGTDEFATDVRDAVLTERAALDVLIEWAGAPREELSFLGHSGGGALGAILCAVEPRLSRIGIFDYGAGTLARSARSARAREIRAGRAFAGDVAADADWFDAARIVGVERSARLFVQHGRSDRTVPIIEGRALFDAAAFPKLWVEYDWDHGLDADPQARKDRADFLST